MHTPVQAGKMWRRSSFSDQGEHCVELHPNGAARDSKNSAGPALSVDLSSLISAVKAGKFDL